jgi:hypothetical protein
MNMNKFFLVAALIIAAYFAVIRGESAPLDAGVAGSHAIFAPALDQRAMAKVSDDPNPLPPDRDDAILAKAFASRESNLQVGGQGMVERVLPDDEDGSRHQRFVLRLGSGQTLLVSHNIDLAPRIDLLGEGDAVAFYGEYEWNPQGGVIHWTHHDPQGSHSAGWLRHKGQTYQ